MLEQDRRLNLVMVVSDTLRRDHLGCYGNENVRTPHLNALASTSVVFDNYYAASFPTIPARCDLFLGQWTFAKWPWGPLPSSEPSLPAVLRAAGYRTAAVVDTPFMIQNGFHYDRGFEFFVDLGDNQKEGVGSRVIRGGQRWAQSAGPILQQSRVSEYDYPTAKTMATAEQCLEALHARPFFLYVDTWGSHEPWDPPGYYVRQYKPDYDGRVVIPPYGDWRAAGLTEDDLETARACYCAEITLVDRWVGRLLERIESLGIAEDTVVVFLSDHGYYFGERGQLGKMVAAADPRSVATNAIEGVSVAPVWRRSPLYEELTHVPLMIRAPEAPPGRQQAFVSAVDVMPTLLDLLNVTAPAGLDGESVAPGARGHAVAGREFVVSAMPLANPGEVVRVVDDQMRLNVDFQPATVTTAEWALLFSSSRDSVELYDRRTDPQQVTDVAAAHPEVVRELHGRYIGLLEEVGTSETYLTPRRHVGTV